LRRSEDFKKIRATYWLGVCLIIVFWVTSEGNLIVSDDYWLIRLGVNNIEGFNFGWLRESITHIFIHANWLHSITNLLFLGLMSIYERRVGAKRFIAVFMISGVLSATSVWFSEPIVAMGASGGLMGLAAGYVVDVPKQTLKEYLVGAGMVLIVFAIMMTYQNIKFSHPADLNIDNLGHLFGLVIGLIYCKFHTINER